MNKLPIEARPLTTASALPKRRKARLASGLLIVSSWVGRLERAKGFEPSTLTLARLCSTPELHPRSVCCRDDLVVRRRRAICPIETPIATHILTNTSSSCRLVDRGACHTTICGRKKVREYPDPPCLKGLVYPMSTPFNGVAAAPQSTPPAGALIKESSDRAF